MSNYNLIGSRLTEAQIAALCAKRPISMAEDGQIKTGPVRLSFPSIANKSSYEGGTPKYQAALLFPHKNMGPLMEILRAAVKGFFPNVSDPNVFLDKYNKDHPLRDQALKVNVSEGGRNALKATLEGYTAGFAFMNPKSEKYQPKVFHVVAGQWVPVLPEDIEKTFYAGCWVDAKVNVYKAGGKNPGAAMGLTALWKLADDNPLGGSGSKGASASEGGSVEDAFAADDPNNLPAQEEQW